MAQRSAPAPFLVKTYQLVDDRSTDEVISWNETGATFVVWKTADFAKDLLPICFKHNNFSSFVRQLNTYGFRKIVADKWEFANENFKRGQQELLSRIRRRKPVASVPGRTPAVRGHSSPSNSGENPGSTYTSSPASKDADAQARAQIADLSGENEKLKNDNELLSSELAQAKKQCEELITFLTKYVKVGPDQINRIMRQGSSGSTRDGSGGVVGATVDDEFDDDENRGEEIENGLKLFGVWVKGKEKKRVRGDNLGVGGTHRKEMKTFNFDVPWMTSKACNEWACDAEANRAAYSKNQCTSF